MTVEMETHPMPLGKAEFAMRKLQSLHAVESVELLWGSAAKKDMLV